MPNEYRESQADSGSEGVLNSSTSLLDAVGHAVVATDLSGRIVYWNRAAGEIYGLSYDEVRGRRVQDLLGPSEVSEGTDEIPRDPGRGWDLASEITVRRVDGELFTMLTSRDPVYGREGQRIGTVCVSTDFTERKRMEERLRESEERFRRLHDATFEGIFIHDGHKIIESNETLAVMSGYSREEMVGAPGLGFVEPGSRGAVSRHILMGSGDPYEVVGIRKDGRRLELEVRGREFLYQGLSTRLVSVRDVTERKRAEERLRALAEVSRAFAEAGNDPYQLPAAIVDVVSDTFGDLCGIILFSDDGRTLLPFIYSHPDDEVAAVFREAMGQLVPVGQGLVSRAAETGEPVFVPSGAAEMMKQSVAPEYREYVDRLRIDGVLAVPLRVRGRVIGAIGLARTRRGEPYGAGDLVLLEDLAWRAALAMDSARLYRAAQREIVERERVEEQLQYQAFHDILSGLPNRYLLLDRLGHALSRTERRVGVQVAVLFLDLDDFKIVNDSLGHEAGDRLLRDVAQRLGGCLRAEDTLARFGGDEFIVLIEEVTDPENALSVAERIVQLFGEAFVVEGRALHLSCSVGVAFGAAPAHGPEDLIRNADTAMYQSKESATPYAVFDPRMHARVARRMETESDLRSAVSNEELTIHYQPIVRLATGVTWGVEALVRWEHPERGLLSPAEFIPVAEQTGLILPIGEWVLRRATRHASEWAARYPRAHPIVLAVNLSVRQLASVNLITLVTSALEESGLDRTCLNLDVTETLYMQALEGNTQVLDRLKRMGVKISIDDFGVGYSSLSYLKRLPADVLKLDRSLVRGVGEDLEDTAIVGMVVDLAHTLGMEVVAEGVESAGQARALEEMGCDLAQGYYYSAPLPADEILDFLGP